jgi:hypothetical protein
MKPYLPRPPHWTNGQATAPRSGGDDLSEFSHAFCSFVVVAAASGPVGSLVGQLAELAGARAVGIAGGREKCRSVVEEFRFDALSIIVHLTLPKGSQLPVRMGSMFISKTSAAPFGKLCCPCSTRLRACQSAG